MGSGGDESTAAADDTGEESTAVASRAATALLPSLDSRVLALLGGVAVVLLAAVALGMVPVGGSTTAESDLSATAPTTTVGPNETTDTPATTMQVRSIESCGRRCRDVTVALSNEGEAAARNVRVVTTVTTDGALVWEGRSEVGRLPAGDTVTRTRTVEVGYADAARIEANDGVIRIETTIRTANGTRTFTERRDVS